MGKGRRGGLASTRWLYMGRFRIRGLIFRSAGMVRFDHERSKRDIPPNAHVASNALLLLTPSQECEVISVVPGSGLIRDELMPILVLIPFLVGVRARQATQPFSTAIAPMLVHFPPLRYPRGVDFSQRNSHRSGRHVPRPCKRSRQAPPSSPCVQLGMCADHRCASVILSDPITTFFHPLLAP